MSERFDSSLPAPVLATADGARDPGASERWEKRTEWLLAAAAVVFLIAYAWPILDPGLPHPVHHSCDIVIYIVWAGFGLDYAVRLKLAERRWHFVFHHIPDLLSLALPVLRPLRLLRLVALVRVLNRQATDSLQGRVTTYVGTSTVLIVFVAALAVLDAERGKAGSNINSFGDALWWAVSTMTTVGYGDRFPVTTEGRFVAVGLMVGGIALIGVITASIASWLIAGVRSAEAVIESSFRDDLSSLEAKVDRIETLLVALAEQRLDPPLAEARSSSEWPSYSGAERITPVP